MVRQNRRRAESGFYHVVLKGSGSQILFEDNDDRRAFLSYLEEMLARYDSQLIAWCLMDNHVHLVVSDARGKVSACIHDLATSYAVYFNKRHNRGGQVFDGRFHSVPIESDRQLLCAVRYVHDNPAKAGISTTDTYAWSSYRAYLQGRSGCTSIGLVLDMLGDARGFKAFSESSEYADYEFRAGARWTDEEALEAVREVVGGVPSSIKALPVHERNECLRLLRDRGLSVRQLERLTGIGRGIITRAVRC